MDLCLRAGDVAADEALRLGLVTSVYPDEVFHDEAMKLAERIAAFPALQVKLTKRLLWENAAEFDPDAVMRRESTVFLDMLRTLKRDKPL